MKSIRFFDDPIVKISAWLTEREQKWMREVIAKKYPGIIDPQVYWIIGTDKENEGLSSDPVERDVQRISLSQIGVFMAQRMWARRTWIMVPLLAVLGMVISYILINKSGTTPHPTLIPATIAITVWLSIMLCFGATFFVPLIAQFFLPRTPIRQDEIDSVKGVVSRCIVRDVAPDTPTDLADRPRVLVADAEGRAVAGQVLATDLEYSAVRAEWVKSRSTLFVLGLALLSPVLAVAATWAALLAYYSALLHNTDGPRPAPQPGEQPPSIWWGVFKWLLLPGGLGIAMTSGVPKYVDSLVPASAHVAQWVFVLVVWGLALLKVMKSPSPLGMRAMLLEQSVRESGSELLIDKAGRAHFVGQEAARNAQLDNARKDASPFIELGKSSGLLAQRRDPLAPTEAGLPVGLSVSDLSTHLGVLGASGTGKTSGVIRPLTKAWLSADLGGLLVLDGKGALPLELNGLHAGYRLISPAQGAFNPIAGMNPDAVADVLADVFDPETSGDNRIWSDSARLMLRMAAIVLDAHPALPYTIGELQRFCLMNNAARVEVLADLADQSTSNPRLAAAFNYWMIEVLPPQMPEKTYGSISNMVRTWLGNICLHERLGPWTDTVKSDASIEDAMRGAKLGLLLPESEYGIGGVAISTLCMRRLYDGVKARGDNWRTLDGHTAVLLAADEVQNLLTRADLETVPVARSLGLHLMFATQNVDGLYKRLDKDGAVQLLGNLASIVALPPRTDDSNAYVAKRAGNIWRATTSTYYGLPDAAADLNLYGNSGVDRTMREVALHRQSRIGSPRLSYAINLWHRAWAPKAMAWLDDLAAPDDTNQLTPKPVLSFGLEPLVTADELDTLLAQPGTALAIFNRGRVQRRDVIRLGGVA